MPLRLACPAMGTRFELVLAGQREAHLRAAGEAALAEVRTLHSAWSAFSRDSLVSHLAREAGGGWTRVDPETFDLLERCVALHAASGGAFHPLLAPLLAAAGLRGAASSPPGPASLEVSGLQLDAERSAVRLATPGMGLDLGAIAKGAALDAAAAVLEEEEVTCALLHGGTSTVLALDPPPGRESWRVAVGSSPGAPVLDLTRSAMSVSAARSRVGTSEAGSQGHILDPRTGRSAAGPQAAVVTGARAADCDGWSTALVAGASPTLLPNALEALLQDSEGHWHPAQTAAARQTIHS